MGSKNKKTWDAIFTDPVKADIEWHDIESLFVTAGLGALVPFRFGATGEIVVITLKKG